MVPLMGRGFDEWTVASTTNRWRGGASKGVVLAWWSDGGVGNREDEVAGWWVEWGAAWSMDVRSKVVGRSGVLDVSEEKYEGGYFKGFIGMGLFIRLGYS